MHSQEGGCWWKWHCFVFADGTAFEFSTLLLNWSHSCKAWCEVNHQNNVLVFTRLASIADAQHWDAILRRSASWPGLSVCVYPQYCSLVVKLSALYFLCSPTTATLTHLCCHWPFYICMLFLSQPFCCNMHFKKTFCFHQLVWLVLPRTVGCIYLSSKQLVTSSLGVICKACNGCTRR